MTTKWFRFRFLRKTGKFLRLFMVLTMVLSTLSLTIQPVSAEEDIEPSTTPQGEETAPTQDPSGAPAEIPLCYTLTFSHEGSGSDPLADPANSEGCVAGAYLAGELISLDGAIPDDGWKISGWSGTSMDASTEVGNSLYMPPGAHNVTVVYINILNPVDSIQEIDVQALPPSTPSLISPANNALVTDLTPRLDWSNSSLPSGTVFDYYQLQVATDSGFTALVLDENIPGQTNSEYTLTDDLLPNTRYYWRVMAYNNTGQYSSWSGVRYFREAMLAPILLAPANGAKPHTLRPAFDWEDVEGAIGYTIQVSSYSNLSSPMVNVSVAGSEYLPTKDLMKNKTLYWRVRANGANGPSIWSEVRTMEIVTDIKIANLSPLTGPVPAFGKSTTNGFKFAVDEWNAKGGVLGMKIVPIIKDSQCTAGPAVIAANYVIDKDKVKYIVGEVCSGASIPVSEIAEAKRVVQIAPPSTNPKVTLNEDGSTKQYVFRACFIDPFQGRVMAKFATEQGFNTAFIMVDQENDYVRGLADAFETNFVSLGGEVVGKENYTGTDTDFSAILTKVADSGAEVLYLPDYYNVVNLVGAQAKQLGVTAVMMGGDGWDTVDLDLDAMDGGYYSGHYSPDDLRQVVVDWVAKYKAKYGTVPDALATLAYDATNLLLTAIKEAGTDDSTAVAAAMETLDIEVVSGEITFDAQHNPIKSAVVFQVKDGNVIFFTLVSP